MKLIFGAAVLLLVLSGCAAEQGAPAPAPVAQQTLESATAEPTASESEPTEERIEADQDSEQSLEAEATSEPTAEPATEETTQATTQPRQSESPSPTATAAPAPSPTASPSPTPTEEVVAGYTMAEVRQNNTASSCWVAVDGRVFNLTQWIARHPGGSGAITQLCGTDGTISFNSRHGGQSSPTAALESYDIGSLR